MPWMELLKYVGFTVATGWMVYCVGSFAWGFYKGYTKKR